MITPLITIDWDSPDAVFTQVFALGIGDCFKFTKHIETLHSQLEAKRIEISVLEVFKVKVATPGSPYYTIQGDNTFVVVEKA